MKERPILFSAPMVRALFAGFKTQTRRLVKPQPEPFEQATPDRHPLKHDAPYIDAYCSEPKTDTNPRGMSTLWCWWTRDDRHGATVGRCPYGVPGDRLWVRETFRQGYGSMSVHYAADPDEVSGGPWRPSIFMPRWASRITLEITEVRVQRLQEISEEDAIAEGCPDTPGWRCNPRGWYHGLWDSINGERHPWSSNPWVWALTFERVEARG